MGFLDSGMVVVLIITAVLLFVTALLLFYNFEVALSLSLSIKPTSWVWSISLTFELTFVKMQWRHNFATFFYLPPSKQITPLCPFCMLIICFSPSINVNHLLLTTRVIATPIPPRWDGFKMNACKTLKDKYMWTIPRQIHVDNSKKNACRKLSSR